MENKTKKLTLKKPNLKLTYNDILNMNNSAVEAITDNKIELGFKILKQTELELEVSIIKYISNLLL